MIRSLRFCGILCFLACVATCYVAADDVAQLVEQLKSKDAMVRGDAARKLGSLQSAATSATSALAAALRDPQEEVRAYAADALGAIGDRRKEIVDALFAAATDKSPLVRRETLQALRSLNLPPEESVPRFAQMLHAAKPEDVGPVLQTLAEAGEKSVPFLIECLNQGDCAYWACLALAEIGPDAKAATPGLSKLAAHPDAEMRLEAVVALGEIGPDAKASVPVLVERLTKDEFGGVRYAAAYSLGKIGESTPQVDSALKEAAKSPDAFLRLLAIWSEAQLHPDDRAALDTAAGAIIEALKSDDAQLRAAAARCLVESKRSAAQAEVVAPHLAAGLKDADPVVVATALDAIAAMGEKAVPRAVTALENPDIRLYAAAVLQRIGVKASAAVPALVKALDANDKEFQREVQYALASIGAASAPAVPALTKALESPDEEVRHSAAYALGSIGEGAKSAAPALVKALSSPDDFTRFGAAWALVRVAKPDAAQLAKILPVLIEALGDDAPDVRVGAADTLAQLGPAAKSAVPALQKAKANNTGEIQAAIDRALAKISG